jgi:hypothetical protein
VYLRCEARIDPAMALRELGAIFTSRAGYRRPGPILRWGRPARRPTDKEAEAQMNVPANDLSTRMMLDSPPRWRPGDIVMHARQFNHLNDLMRVQRQGSKSQVTWNGVPVHIDNTLPPTGWYLVPGTE